MADLKKEILEALHKVKHPGVGNDVVSLNMVKNLTVEQHKVSLELAFPSANDPLKNSVKKACAKAIQAVAGPEREVEVLATAQVSSGRKDNSEMLPGVKNIIAVASGKGGVGKSTIATNLAVGLSMRGAKVGLIDADVYGPSIPKMFKVEDQRPLLRKVNNKELVVPVMQYGVKVLSIGFFVHPEDALIWRGVLATNALNQLLSEGLWGELDYLVIDLPPGTSDIHLSMVQSVPVTGAVIVTTPQDVAVADAIKGIAMFRQDKINVPVLGLVENMSWFTPENHPEERYYIFGKDGGKNLAFRYDMPLLGQIPIVEKIREQSDAGEPSVLDEDSLIGKQFLELADNVANAVAERNAKLAPTQIVQITEK